MKLITCVLACFLAVNVAADDFLVADGSSSGTYQQMLKEINDVCSGEVAIKEVPSSGAVENLDKLVGNEASGAFVHSDVIYFRSQTEDLGKIKTLYALYPEEVHFLAPAVSKVATGGLVGRIRGETEVFNNVGDLDGARVGAAGGGFITAQVIRLQSQIAFSVVQYSSGKDVMAALDRGDIEAALFVGGAPLPNLKDLGTEYKLLSIPDNIVDRLKAVYRPARVTYTKMSPNSVSTVAADALFVAREYKTPKMVQQLARFRRCLDSHLDELKETPGKHRKWQQVESSNHGKWPWMELPNK